MSEDLPPNARTSPPAIRNRGPILAVLQPRLPATGLVLEIASGTGEHAVHIASAMPGLQWQPTDPDRDAFASIEAWRNQACLPNLLPPLQLDAAAPDHWPVKSADAVVNINMIHIAPWAATQGLMQGASRVLPPGGQLFLYGPYFERDVVTAPSNLEFDQSLKSRNPAWGIRHLDDVAALAGEHGLKLVERIAMPANNLIVIFKRV
ncbi:MAG: SAM-dependent methyltransferase [Acidocella sp. 20-57-95]|nr:MAG: SAM-dependent methyltransferase [Acidocella sp. 20-57-95]HQT63718.1 DUF938 domain-containing protein [Acidocella sp.]HQU05545.1 DUF938 domain-containing protein [Acidocella sp.]